MTLKLTRFLTDLMNKQAKISHFNPMIQVGKPSALKSEIKKQIIDVFGNLFLEDANFVIMTTFNPSDSDEQKQFIKKFAELVGTVFQTNVLKTDVKSFEIKNEGDNTVDDIDDKDDIDIDDMDDGSEEDDNTTTNTDVPNTTTVLIIKVTTK